MANEWIIDVLADLKAYALRHNCMALAEQLDDAMVVAAAEVIVEADAREERLLPPARPAGKAAHLAPVG